MIKKVLMLSLILSLVCGCAQNQNAVNANSYESVTETETVVVTETYTILDTKTVKQLLAIAMEPVGQTMYVWGGGWNEEDTGAGIEAVTLGISPRWKDFFEQQDVNYDIKNSWYQIHDGLDCSGYIGWVVYNVLENESGKEGYVDSSTKMADLFAQKGLGNVEEINAETIFYPGDIVSMDGHVWMVLGMCEDGSVLLSHSSPPGVRISGTEKDGGSSQAVLLANEVMSTYYPKWYEKYPECAVKENYLSGKVFRWNETLRDDESVRDMTAEEVVGMLFGIEKK